MDDMPIMHGRFLKALPMCMFEGHEEQAMRNHSQTLRTLAARGGLAPSEALAILDNRRLIGANPFDEYTLIRRMMREEQKG